MAVKVTVYGTADMKQIERARDELDRLEKQALTSAGGFQGAMARFSASATSAGESMTAAGASMTRNLTVPLAALGFALYKATENAANDAQAQVILAGALRNNAGATDAAVASTERWITKQGELLGVSDDQLRPALSTLVGATKDVAKSQELAGLAMDIAAARGVPVETAAKAIAKAYAGQTSQLTKLVPGIDKAAVAAGDWGVIQANVSSIVGGQAAAAADTQAGALARNKVALDEATESLGTAFLPIVTTVTQFIQNSVVPAITAVANWFGKLDNGTKMAILGFGAFLAILGPALMVLGSMATGIGAIAGVLSKLTLISKIATAAQWLWNVALTANPIGLIIVAITALVGAMVWFFTQTDIGRQIWGGFVGFLTDTWENFTRFLNQAWTNITNFVNAAVTNVVSFVKSHWGLLLSFIIGPLGLAIQWIVENWSGIVRFFSGVWNSIVSGVSGMVASVLGFFRDLNSKILSILSGAATWLVNVGRDIVTGLWNGIKGGWNWLADMVGGLVDNLIGGVKDMLGIKSPSRVFAEIGRNVSAGMANGINAAAPAVSKALDGLASMGAATVAAGTMTASLTSGAMGSGSPNLNVAASVPAVSSSSVQVAEGAIQISFNGDVNQSDAQRVVEDAFAQLVRELRAS